ncbi:hypothetical protein NBV64_05995 [Alcaligenes sp. DN25]|uniref:hypothetical protein n=1 Tax=Alcaligenes TaxID=507 RepID=UPI00202EB0B3|nr:MULTISPECIES: hypothetical protein [Alcaligenes]URW83904.1 hypothetical protein NBV64_05995 [Alcaligenes sp. DN25]WEA68742.1 hypothetical protein PWH35_06005 [Alcaligenes faecalis]
MRGVLVDFDWSEIILDLRRAGMGQNEIAREMGHAVGEAMVRQYLAGASPAHWRGEMLLEIWERRTGQPRDKAPRRPAEMHRATTARRPRQRPAALMPTEHLPAVAQAYGITVPALLQMLAKQKPAGRTDAGHNLSLPGFEE